MKKRMRVAIFDIMSRRCENAISNVSSLTISLDFCIDLKEALDQEFFKPKRKVRK